MKSVITWSDRNLHAYLIIGRIIFFFYNYHSFMIYYHLPGNDHQFCILHLIHLPFIGKDMVSLKELILKEKDGIDEEVTDIESDEEDKEEKDNVEILNSCLQKLK